jgi:hypothetical protein
MHPPCPRPCQLTLTDNPWPLLSDWSHVPRSASPLSLGSSWKRPLGSKLARCVVRRVSPLLSIATHVTLALPTPAEMYPAASRSMMLTDATLPRFILQGFRQPLAGYLAATERARGYANPAHAHTH